MERSAMTRWEMFIVIGSWSLVGIAGFVTLYLSQTVRL